MYNIGDKVLLKRGAENTYETPYQGPFTFTQVNENGTVQMMINQDRIMRSHLGL
jgi:hypothetical protein